MFFTFKDLEKDLLDPGNGLKVLSDSRNIEKGSLFLAIKGEKVDGHNFLKEVAAKGAFGAVVESSYSGEEFGLRLYKVDSVIKAVQLIAKRKLEKVGAKVVAITGSVGKTTTKEFLCQLLKSKYRVYTNPKNFNSQVGLPISILNMVGDFDVIVLEMGMSLKGEMELLADIVKPDIALFTPIGYVHAKNFNEIDEIVWEKSRIICEKRTKKVIIPIDLLKYPVFSKRQNLVTYSLENNGADFILKTDEKNIVINGKKSSFFSKVFSESHFLQDFLGAYIVAKEMKVEDEEIENGLKFLKAQPMRFEKQKKDNILFVLDCYNANSLSTIAALKNLPNVDGKKIAVLGEMGDLGNFSKMSHEMVGREAAKSVDFLLCLGFETKYLKDEFDKYKKSDRFSYYFDSLNHLIKKLKEISNERDLVLIKGSRYLQLEKIINSDIWD